MEKRIELEALITEREGMIAENKVRESLGHSLAYTYDCFSVLASQMRELKEKPADRPESEDYRTKYESLRSQIGEVRDSIRASVNNISSVRTRNDGMSVMNGLFESIAALDKLAKGE